MRLVSFIEKYNLLSDSQYGFRQNRSTSLALIDLTEEITDGIEKNTFVIGMLIDLQKAFDTINHNILIDKLEKYGIRGLTKNGYRAIWATGSKLYRLTNTNRGIWTLRVGYLKGQF